jgi:hypothetical protein
LIPDMMSSIIWPFSPTLQSDWLMLLILEIGK